MQSKFVLLALLLAYPLVVQSQNSSAPDTLSEAAPGKEKPAGQAAPQDHAFPVKQIEITGNRIFDAATLHALVADGEGKMLTMADLTKLAARITDFYRRHDRPFVRTIIPPQTISSGVVRFRIVPAYYGQITINNASRIADSILNDALAPLQGHQEITLSTLERSLLLLHDVPGIVINSTLSAGAAANTTDVTVHVADGSRAAGYLTLDNYGSRYTGSIQAGAGASLHSPLRRGDLLNVAATSSGDGLTYGNASYDYPVNGRGSHIGISYSHLRYAFRDAAAASGGRGDSEAWSLSLSHPLLRSADANLVGSLKLEQKRLYDDIAESDIQNHRHIESAIFTMSGNIHDLLVGGGDTQYSAGVAAGRLRFEDAKAQAVDALTRQSEGRYVKWYGNLNRLQRLDPRNSLWLSISGQWSNTNLDSAEKIGAGGAYSIRAYEIGALSADNGYWGSLEWRHALTTSLPGQWQFIMLFDSARLTINRRVWQAGPNEVTLCGGGAGLNWEGPRQWVYRAVIAVPACSTDDLPGISKNKRAWMQIEKRF